MAYNFNGKKILVTGAGRNIGRTIATNLARQGAKVYALDCEKERLDDLVAEINDVVPVYQDIRDWDETAKTVNKLGELNGVVNCAAIYPGPQNALDIGESTLNNCIDVNLKAPVNVMQVVSKKMTATGKGGSIVNISTIVSSHAIKGRLPYCVAKAGLDMATKMFALELGPHKIRVNSVNPGLLRTDMTIPSTPEEGFQRSAAITPLGRIPEKQDVANLVLFLLSDQSLMITGTIQPIDGGMTCQIPS